MNINLHIDCDPLWVYASEYGLQPDYKNTLTYETSLPALLEMLQARRSAEEIGHVPEEPGLLEQD